MLLTSLDSKAGRWKKMNQCNGRILPLRHDTLLLPLEPPQVPPPHCQQWRLSVGGQTLEQTLPIREVTPLGWQAHYRAWVPSREPYGFWAKDVPERNKGVSLMAIAVTWEAPSARVSQVKMKDELSFSAGLIWCYCCSISYDLTSFRESLHWICLGNIETVLLFFFTLPLSPLLHKRWVLPFYTG